MPYSTWAPLAPWADLVTLLVRLLMGGILVYYGWPKVKDPRKNADDFGKIGFTPGWFWGSLVLLTEFGGGLAIAAGVYTWVAAALVAVEMFTGTVWKLAIVGKPFTDYSYDILLLALALMLLGTGPGAYAVAWQSAP
jgi:putative oxidoreductase